MKKILIFVLMLTSTLVLSAQLRPTQIEATTGDFDGSFNTIGFNNAPKLLRFQGPRQEGTGALTPQTEYSLLLEVEDLDGIRDLQALEFRFYYGVTGGGVQPDDFADLEDIFLNYETTPDTGEVLVMRWENRGGRWQSPETVTRPDNPNEGFQIVLENNASLSPTDSPDDFPERLMDGSQRQLAGVSATGISWEIINSTVPAISSSGIIEGTTFTFEVTFRISKVAPQTSLTLWRVGALIEDARVVIDLDEDQVNNGLSVFPTLKTSTTNPLPQNNDFGPNNADVYSMNFYAEITLEDQLVADWDDEAYDNSIRPGGSFADNNHVSLPGIRYIANGEFTRQIQSDPQWVATAAGVASSDPDVVTYAAIIQHQALISSSEDVFRIAAVDEALNNPINFADATSFIVLRGGGQKSNFADLPRTTEVGVTYDYYLFIELSQAFRDGTYQADLTLTVTNTLN